MSLERFDVCGVKVSATNIPKACATIDGWVKSKRKAYVCVAPVSTIVECREDQAYRNVINHADMVTPDGMPLVWIAKSRGIKNVERTYGPDLMMAISEQSEAGGYKHYFYGATEDTCQKLESTLKGKFPRINIVGKYSPPFRELTETENEEIISKINQSKADILWVGLGAPKQDFWIKNNRDKLEVPVLLGVGAAFDFLSGVKKQAPSWMQRLGLEWLFRLCCEPKRLWRRYLLGNTKFIMFIISDLFKKKESKP